MKPWGKQTIQVMRIMNSSRMGVIFKIGLVAITGLWACLVIWEAEVGFDNRNYLFI
jgi:hypothetical protein